MIEVNFLDARGTKILSLNTKEDIEFFFENTVQKVKNYLKLKIENMETK